MKTKEELKLLKSEAKALGTKFSELTEDELQEVTGGVSLEAFLRELGLSKLMGLREDNRPNEFIGLKDNVAMADNLRDVNGLVDPWKDPQPKL